MLGVQDNTILINDIMKYYIIDILEKIENEYKDSKIKNITYKINAKLMLSVYFDR